MMNDGRMLNNGYDVEAAVLGYVQQCRICSMEELFRNLPAFTVIQMFLTVDRLSREGKIILRYWNRSEYVIVPADVADELPSEMLGAPVGDRI